MLMPQTFDGSNDLSTKGHDMEIHLNKLKKSVIEGGRTKHSLTMVVNLKERALYALELSFSKNAGPTKAVMSRNAAIAVAQVSYQAVPKLKGDETLTLQKRQ